MMERTILTPAEAESLLPDGDWTHSMSAAGGMVLGCDMSRAAAVDLFAGADCIELGGPTSYALRHPIMVTSSGRLLGIQADMDRVATLEASRAAAA